jgi:hypothetical protein
MLTNTFIIQSSLDIYQLEIPWLILFLSILLSMLSGILICQAEQYFVKKDRSVKSNA